MCMPQCRIRLVARGVGHGGCQCVYQYFFVFSMCMLYSEGHNVNNFGLCIEGLVD